MRVRAIGVLLTAALAAGLSACGDAEPAAPAAAPTSAPTTSAPPTSAPATSAPATTAPPSTQPASGALQRITIDGAPALQWGSGARGVVLAHGASYDAISWRKQAVAIAAAGFRVVAVEDISPDGIGAAVRLLRREGATDVALLGASAGADGVLALASSEPDIADQLILLSPNRVVRGLGAEPKLFVASRDERVADVSPQLAKAAPGSDNEVTLLPGKAHAQAIFRTDRGPQVLAAIIARLERAGP